MSALANGSLFRFLGTILASTRRSIRYAAQIQSPPDQMIPHTGAILGPAAADKHDAMLLDVVPLAGDVGRDDGARRQLDSGRLALPGVGLLGADDADAEADALQGRAVCVGEGGRDGMAGALALPDAAEDLVQGRGARARGREGGDMAQRGRERTGEGGCGGRAGRACGEEEAADDGAGRSRGRAEGLHAGGDESRLLGRGGVFFVLRLFAGRSGRWSPAIEDWEN